MGVFKKLFSSNNNVIQNHDGANNIKGYIGLFNLEEWWLYEFSAQERQYIVNKYGVTTSDGKNYYNENQLINGEVFYNGSVASFLASLSSWFSTKEDLEIAKKLLLKAELLFNDNMPILDKHFYYMHNIKIYYKDRENESSLIKAINYCKEQISISKIAKEIFLSEQPENFLPTHTGYEQLAIIEEKRGNIINALNLSKQAKLEGWSNEWDKRILRLEKKLNK